MIENPEQFVRQYFPNAVAQAMHVGVKPKWNIYPHRYGPLWCIVNANTQAKAWQVFATSTQLRFAAVDLISPYDLREMVEKRLRPVAKKFKKKPLHWVHNGPDEAISYCERCAGKAIKILEKENPAEEYMLDGGWGSDADSQEFCDTCGTPLDCSFTEYACEEELRHFGEYGFDVRCPSDCDSFLEMSQTLPSYDPEESNPLYLHLHLLTKQIAQKLFS